VEDSKTALWHHFQGLYNSHPFRASGDNEEMPEEASKRRAWKEAAWILNVIFGLGIRRERGSVVIDSGRWLRR
jgi:hypothetical protein